MKLTFSCIAVLLILSSFSQSITKDELWGNGGIVVLGPNDQSFTIADLTLLEGEGLVVTGARSEEPFADYPDLRESALIKLEANGFPDTDFGNSGIILPQLYYDENHWLTDAAFGSDGNLYILGGMQSGQGVGISWFLQRYDESGQIDASFGENGLQEFYLGQTGYNRDEMIMRPDGSGFYISGTSFSYSLFQTSSEVFHFDIAQESLNFLGGFGTNFEFNKTYKGVADEAGDLFLAMAYQGEEEGNGAYTPLATVAKFTPSGLESGFADEGLYVHENSNEFDWYIDMKLTEDGNIMALGRFSENGADLVLTKLDQEGVPVGNFGTGGHAYFAMDDTHRGKAVFELPSQEGYVVLAERGIGEETEVGFFALDAAGDVLENFGDQGFAEIEELSGDRVVYGVQLEDESVIIAGNRLNGIGESEGVLIKLNFDLGYESPDQVWAALNSGSQRVYSGYAVTIDEVFFDGDSVFIPGKNWSTFDSFCYYADSTSILGREVRISASGTHRFILYDNDTLTLHFQENTSPPWIAYESDDAIVQAVVSETAQEEVLGILQEVRTISLQMLNDDMEPIQAEVNAYEFRIGSESGLLAFPNLAAFPNFFSTPSQNLYQAEIEGIFPDLGIQDLTTFDIYDFQPGDEIHYEEGTQSFADFDVTQYAEEILDRTDYADSIVYTIEVTTYTPDSPTPTGSWVESRTIEPDPLLDTPSGQSYVEEGALGFLAWIDEGIHGTSKLTVHNDAVLGSNGLDDCFGEIIDYGCFQFGIDHYIKGLGGPYYQCVSGPTFSTWCELLYFDKDGTEWGVPLSADEILVRNDFRIFPNPAASEFRLEVDTHFSLEAVRLVDMRGRTVKQFHGLLDRYPVDDLKSGIYILELTTKEGLSISEKLLIK